MRSLLLILSLTACATTAPDSDPYDATLGAADGAGTTVRDVNAGDQLTLTIDTGSLVALHVTNAPAAVLVRRVDGDINPYALVTRLTKDTVAQSFDQVIAPAAGIHDALVTVPDDQLITFISGEDLATGGTVTIDIVALDNPLTTQLEGTIAKTIGRDLRALEPQRAAALASGYLSERDDATVEPIEQNIPLDQRATIRALASTLTNDRATLCDTLAIEKRDYARILSATE